MERFLTLIGRKIPIDAPTRQLLETHGQLRGFKAGDYFLLSGETKRYWCFILAGMAAAVDRNSEFGTYYRYVVVPHGYFTGTKHPFSQSQPGLFIQFLRPTTLFLLPLDSFRYAQENLLPFGNFVQVLKQRRLLMQEALAEVLAQSRIRRYGTLYALLPEVFHALNDEERRKLLRVDRATYYKAKAVFGR